MEQALTEQEFDFAGFLGRVFNMSLDEMIEAAEKEAERVERLLHPPKGERGVGKRLSYPAHHYSTLLGGFLFFLRAGGKHGIKPTGMTKAEFMSLKPVLEELVEKRDLPPSVLEAFYS
jgi:hypothetical protein